MNGTGIDIQINGSMYTVAEIVDLQSGADLIWTVLRHKQNISGKRERYTVACNEGIWCCDCADWHYRREDTTPEPCKHIGAVLFWMKFIGHAKLPSRPECPEAGRRSGHAARGILSVE